MGGCGGGSARRWEREVRSDSGVARLRHRLHSVATASPAGVSNNSSSVAADVPHRRGWPRLASPRHRPQSLASPSSRSVRALPSFSCALGRGLERRWKKKKEENDWCGPLVSREVCGEFVGAKGKSNCKILASWSNRYLERQKWHSVGDALKQYAPKHVVSHSIGEVSPCCHVCPRLKKFHSFPPNMNPRVGIFVFFYFFLN